MLESYYFGCPPFLLITVALRDRVNGAKKATEAHNGQHIMFAEGWLVDEGETRCEGTPRATVALGTRPP